MQRYMNRHKSYNDENKPGRIMDNTIRKHIIQKYLKKIEGNRIICELCPNDCVINEGNVGVCRTRVNIDGALYSIVYGYPCSINIDPVEKKPLYHYAPGQGILSIGTYGCNLSCKGCQNFSITRCDVPESTRRLKYYGPEEIVDMAVKNGIKMIAYTYNEPTIFLEYMIDIAKIARQRGLKNVIVSNGYINPEPLKELCRYIDAANIDLKGITKKFYREYSGVKLAPVLNTIKYLHVKKIWLELTNLIIPGLNDDMEDVKKLCQWISTNVGNDVPLHFSRFYPYYHASDIAVTPGRTLENAKDIAHKEGLRYVYVGNLGSQEDTFCDKCGNILVERSKGLVRIKGLDADGSCLKCNAKIPGRFSI